MTCPIFLPLDEAMSTLEIHLDQEPGKNLDR
jgi:hypothetical protein